MYNIKSIIFKKERRNSDGGYLIKEFFLWFFLDLFKSDNFILGHFMKLERLNLPAMMDLVGYYVRNVYFGKAKFIACC